MSKLSTSLASVLLLASIPAAHPDAGRTFEADGAGDVISHNSLYVTPNPCIAGAAGHCSVQLTWHADGDSSHDTTEIWSGDPSSAAFELIACAPASEFVTRTAQDVKRGERVEFRLYQTQGCSQEMPTEKPLASVTVTGVSKGPTYPPASIGLNKIDLLTQYLGRSSRGNGSQKFVEVETRMAKKAILDAIRTGAKFLRVAITGYAPRWYGESNDLTTWLSDPDSHWARVDMMMADLHASGIGVLPSFVFNVRQFPAIAREKIADMFTNSQSQSYQLLTTYIRQFIERYKDHPALFAYELGNEFTQIVDLQLVALCQRRTPGSRCDTTSNVTTNDMLSFTTRLASYIRSLDPTRPIMSGFQLPRPNAHHLRAHPGWVSRASSEAFDSPEQFTRTLKEVNQGVDVITMHYYLSQNKRYSQQFGANVKEYDPFMVDITKNAADAIGKKLYIGEFGDNLRESVATAQSDPAYPFSSSILEKVVSLEIPYSSPWIWEYYQFSLTRAQEFGHADSISLEPGYTDSFIQKIAAANRALGHSPRPRANNAAPIVVITEPLIGARFVAAGEEVFAVASDDEAVAEAQVCVDDVVVSTTKTPPYKYTIDASSLARGRHKISVRAYDRAGLVTEAGTVIADGKIIGYE